MKKNKLITLIILVLSISLVIMGCSNGGSQPANSKSPESQQEQQGNNNPENVEAEYTIKMHVNQPAADTSYHWVFATYMAEKLYQKTNGAVQLEIYPGSQLGTDPEVLEQMKVGTIQSGMFAFPNMINVYKPINIFSLPFLFEDFKSASRGFNGPTAQEVYQEFENASGIKILSVYNGGVRGLTNSVRPINTVEDLKGLKIRTPGTPVLIKTMEGLGASAIGISGNEIFTALQQGTVDGQDSSIGWGYDQGFHEVQKYVTETNHGYTGTCFIINAKYYNELPENLQKAVQEVALEAAAYSDGFCEMYDMAVIDKFKSKGLEVTTLDPKDLRPLVESVWTEFAEDLGGMDRIESLVADGEKKTKN